MIDYKAVVKTLKDTGLFVKTFNEDKNAYFSKIETDSRQIDRNDIFICIKGFQTDGHIFAAEAEEKGAKLFIIQRKLESKTPQILVKNTRKSAAVLAKLCFDDPSKKFKLVGITGTNGKTTVSYLIENILRQNGKKTGLIGTYGYFINGKEYKTERTTPDILELNRIFEKMNSEDVKYVVMEVSSHALALDRVYGINFDVALFTNLTQEHLDFHKNLDDYAETKFKLFLYLEDSSGVAFINVDDAYGDRLYKNLKCEKYSLSFEEADFVIQNCKYLIDLSSFELIYKNEILKVNTNLIGRHNVFNVSSAIAIIKKIAPDISSDSILKYIKNIFPTKGRLENVSINKKINVFIDYAHTPDALKNVLKSLSYFTKGRLICVFGAGGERDKRKRPKMLDAALEFADLSIITNDNPRYEEPADIIRDIVGNTEIDAPYWITRDRKIAIQTAINLAKEDDIVLIAGKGHETYQEVKGKKLHLNDKEVAQSTLIAKELKDDELSIPIDPLQLEYVFGQKLDIASEDVLRFVSTDSRTIQDNSLFFALKGENFDGHDFIKEVQKKKNCWVVVQKEFKSSNRKLIRVEDTLEALGLLAQKYKSLFNVTTIAITGSFGKTTTKEYIYNILIDQASTLKTYSNENNLIGLPKTIFKLKPEHKYAILELGSNQFGEIAKLTEISNPDIGIVTAVGPCHLEFLKDENGVYQEKSALLRSNLKLKLFPGDDDRFKELEGITFGEGLQNNYRISKVSRLVKETKFSVNNDNFIIPTPFDKYSLNAAIAVALSSELGISKANIQEGLNKPLQISLRMEIQKSGNKTLLIDCYNANPDSMKAAINFWVEFQKGKPHIAILGDMLELGELREKLHKDVWKLLSEKEYHQIISVGELARYYQADQHFNNVDELISSDILKILDNDAVILLKASHGIELEKIIGRI